MRRLAPLLLPLALCGCVGGAIAAIPDVVSGRVFTVTQPPLTAEPSYAPSPAAHAPDQLPRTRKQIRT